MPKVSIIVPVYNVEKYLRECLDSLICQTLEDIEIICIDDCSTDNSLQILEEYAKKDKRIIIKKHNKNKGLSASRNTALAMVKSPYIMNCDSDDIFVPEMCEKMYNAITTKDVDIAICGIEVFYETETSEDIKNSDKKYYSIKKDGIQKVTNELISKTNASFCNKIVSCDLIKQHKIEFPTGLNYEDAYFYFAYMPWVDKAFFISENLYKYRRRANSIMSETFNGKANAKDHLDIAFALYDYYKEHKILEKKHDLFWSIFHNFYWLAIRYTTNKKSIQNIHKAAKKFIKKECILNKCSPNLKEKIEHILYPVKTNKQTVVRFLNLIPVLNIKQMTNKTVYKIFGIPLLKIKQKQTNKKVYILGLPLFKIISKG